MLDVFHHSRNSRDVLFARFWVWNTNNYFVCRLFLTVFVFYSFKEIFSPYCASIWREEGCCSFSLSVLPLVKTSVLSISCSRSTSVPKETCGISVFPFSVNCMSQLVLRTHLCFPHLHPTPFSALINSWQVDSDMGAPASLSHWHRGRGQRPWITSPGSKAWDTVPDVQFV